MLVRLFCFVIFAVCVHVAKPAPDVATANAILISDRSTNSAAEPDVSEGNNVQVANASPISRESGLPRGKEDVSSVTPSVVERARLLASEDNPDGHYLLGLLYFYGDGVEESKPRALAFFKEAARLGHVHAHVNAGHMLEHGIATSADATAAYAFYRQAAVRWRDVEACVRAAALLYEGRVSAQITSWEQGMRTAKEMLDVALAASHPRAFFLLGSMHEYGGADFGPDYGVARRLYETGCREHLDAECCYHLALMHAYGRGVVQDWAASGVLFQENADARSHTPSAYFLGLQLAHGQGVPTDYRLAEKYLNQAADGGDARVATKAAAALADLKRANTLAEEMRRGELRALQARIGSTAGPGTGTVVQEPLPLASDDRAPPPVDDGPHAAAALAAARARAAAAQPQPQPQDEGVWSDAAIDSWAAMEL